MADTKISALTAATTPLAGTEVLPIVQSGVTKKVAVSDLTAGRAVSGLSFTATKTYANTSDLGVVVDSNIPGWNLRASGGGRLSMVTGYIGNDISSLLCATGSSNPATEVMRVTHSSGAVNFISSDVTLQAGNLIQGTAAKGINFTANSALAGKTSQLLNYYEEGTWTPTITAYSGTITTSSSSSANYTRVGNVVTFSVVLTVTNNGTGAGYLIFTLPFSGSKGYASAIGVNTSSGATVSGSSDSSSPSTMYMQKTDGTYPIASGQSLRVTGTYLV